MVQNKSHAVMAQRTESKDSLDDFPEFVSHHDDAFHCGVNKKVQRKN